MRWFLFVSLVACGRNAPPVDTGTPPGTTGTAPTNTLPGTPTGTEPPADPVSHLRIVHLCDGLEAIDMHVNSNPTAVLNALDPQTGTPYRDQPPGTFSFQLSETGAGPTAALATFDASLLEDGNQTFAVIGSREQPTVLTTVDDRSGIGANQLRLRWVHAAPDLGTLTITDQNSGIVHAAGLTYGQSSIAEVLTAEMQVGLDEDGDGSDDWVFESFDLAGGDAVHIFVLKTPAGDPWLIAYPANGNTPRRDILGTSTTSSGTTTGSGSGSGTTTAPGTGGTGLGGGTGGTGP